MDEEIRATCKILEAVAKNDSLGSAEREAVRQAAEAFIYLRLHGGLRKGYEAYRRNCAKPLTKAQTQILVKMGVTV